MQDSNNNIQYSGAYTVTSPVVETPGLRPMPTFSGLLNIRLILLIGIVVGVCFGLRVIYLKNDFNNSGKRAVTRLSLTLTPLLDEVSALQVLDALDGELTDREITQIAIYRPNSSNPAFSRQQNSVGLHGEIAEFSREIGRQKGKVTISVRLSGLTQRIIDSAVLLFLFGIGVYFYMLLLYKLFTQMHNSKIRSERANNAKSKFLSSVSYELRTPITGILGMTEMLEESQVKDNQREYVQDIRDCARSLISILDDLGDLSKIEAGKLILRPRVCSLTELTTSTIAALQTRMREKGITLRETLDPRLPAQIRVDAARLVQIINQLVLTSLKLTPSAGQIEFEIRLIQQIDNRCELTFEVRDTGIGLSAEQLEGLDLLDDRSEGSRFSSSIMGLALVKKLVQVMGGMLVISPLPGQGNQASFTIWVEVTQDEVDNRGSAVVSLSADTTRQALRVLLAEDNLINQKVASNILSRNGYVVSCAVDGAKAFELWKNEKFDIILMDVQMPGMDGIQATLQIRAAESKTNSHVPIIALTANAMQGDEETCLAAGMDAFVPKPIDKKRLLETISRVITDQVYRSPESLT